eukprot:TRINITY_DN6082_c0_g1_i1.p1 TRINITY_DN6082_c0_g1~~TRINITY_DN6082_c0_g1_i1.p1  ORF type:complete len:158 (+),score=43.87 TRINITY_DN6082_c0_g1_i1:189-662(+)
MSLHQEEDGGCIDCRPGGRYRDNPKHKFEFSVTSGKRPTSGNPYLYIRESGVNGIDVLVTKIIENTTDPVWNESVTVVLPEGSSVNVQWRDTKKAVAEFSIPVKNTEYSPLKLHGYTLDKTSGPQAEVNIKIKDLGVVPASEVPPHKHSRKFGPGGP